MSGVGVLVGDWGLGIWGWGVEGCRDGVAEGGQDGGAEGFEFLPERGFGAAGLGGERSYVDGKGSGG